MAFRVRSFNRIIGGGRARVEQFDTSRAGFTKLKTCISMIINNILIFAKKVPRKEMPFYYVNCLRLLAITPLNRIRLSSRLYIDIPLNKLSNWLQNSFTVLGT